MSAKAIACPEPLAAETGERTFSAGGTALEGAVAAAFVQGVTNPLGCGLGGMAHILLARSGWPAPRFLNASVAAGSYADPAVFEEGFTGRSERAGRFLLDGDRNHLGYSSIMTPGFLRGMEAVLKLGEGGLNWSALVEPAAAIAAEGFAIYPYLETYYTFEGPDRPGYPDVFRKLSTDPFARALYLPGGRPKRAGQMLRQPEYGRTMQQIGNEGPDEFYLGMLGREMAADFAEHGALVTGGDLAEYRVQGADPLHATFHGLTVYSSPPPGHGAILLTMLNIAERIDLAAMEWNGTDYLETIAWATRSAFGDCIPYLADPSFVTVPSQWLISKERLSAMGEEASRNGLTAAEPADGHTTHLAAGSTEGDAISITHSIGSVAGAGVMTPSLGFLYNNFMGHFNPLRGYHNSIAPGKRMGGGSPALVYKERQPWIAIGSSGGSRLISAVFQTLLDVIVFKMSLQEAVAAPRIHSESGRKIYLEPAFPSAVIDSLQHRGYDVEVTDYMGCNQAVEFTSEDVRPASDPRGGRGVGHWPRL